MAKKTVEQNAKGGNWPALGNEAVLAYLEKSIKNDKVAQAYIFSGPADLGKFTIALTMANNLLASDPNYISRPGVGEAEAFNELDFSPLNSDIHVLKTEEDKKNISIDQTRTFINILGYSSFLNSYKIGIIRGAENLSLEAANALLKTLEEPKDKVVIILTTNDLSRLPATIVSRSQVLYFYPVATDIIYDYLINNYNCDRTLARDLSSLALGRPLRALKFLNDLEYYSNYLKIARVFATWFRTSLNERWVALASIYPNRQTGREAVALASKILEIWQGVTRDLIMINLGTPDLVQHTLILSDLKNSLNFISETRMGVEDLNVYLAEILNRIRQGQIYLQANVAPAYVLENILINL